MEAADSKQRMGNVVVRKASNKLSKHRKQEGINHSWKLVAVNALKIIDSCFVFGLASMEQSKI